MHLAYSVVIIDLLITTIQFMALREQDVIPTYFENYINKVKEPDLLMALLKNKASTELLYRSIPSEKADYRYAEGKWTIKEVLMHVIDTERVMCYRALRFARNDQTELPGMDQDVFAAEYHLDGINIDQLVEQFLAVRNSTILLLRHIKEPQLHYVGKASGWEMTANTLFHVIVGHTEHHNAIVSERYI